MKEAKEWIQSIIMALIIVLPVVFFCRPTYVKGFSMQPTLNDKNIVVTKVGIKHLKRGNIIVFDANPRADELYIKRVIGIPGDVVEIKGGLVYVNGERVKESYLKESTVTEPEMKVTVPENEVFVLGDNREVSDDSRYIGTISIKKIKGLAYFRIFPFSKIGKF